MKYSELIINNSVENENSFNIKKHLQISEINAIINTVLKEDNYIAREIAKGILLVEFCTDIEVEKDDEGAIVLNDKNYDLYNTNNIISMIENTLDERDLFLIEDGISNADSVANTIKNFCNGIQESLEKDESKVNFDELNNIVESLKERVKNNGV